MLIASLPAPHNKQIFAITANPYIDGFRFNAGVVTPDSPQDVLRKISTLIDNKPLWIDLDGRQLRIAKWAAPFYGEIILNREINVDLPAIICFRKDGYATIKAIKRKKIFVDPWPSEALGQGQSVNIIEESLEIKGGYLTKTDKAYIEAACKLGIHSYMLSFVERKEDIDEILALDHEADIVAKIESRRGLDFVRYVYPSLSGVRLMAARDDLYLSLKENDTAMDKALELIFQTDPEAIVASRILTSLEKQNQPSLHDLSDLENLIDRGFTSFMLSDGLCSNPRAFSEASRIFHKTFSLGKDVKNVKTK